MSSIHNEFYDQSDHDLELHRININHDELLAYYGHTEMPLEESVALLPEKDIGNEEYKWKLVG